MNPRLRYDQVLILAVLSLLVFGLVMVFSSSTVISKEVYGNSTEIFVRQLFSVCIGLVLLILAMRTDYHVLQKSPVVWGLLLISMAMLVWALSGPDVNGVNRWIQVGPMRFQPSESAKLVVIVLTSYFVTRNGGHSKDIDRRMLIYFCALASLIVLVMAEPDFGTSISLAVTAAVILFLGGLRYRYYLAALVLACPLFYFLVYQVPYRRLRVMAFLSPESDPYGSGYQILQSLVAVGSGGLVGKGLAQGTQKLFFLPEPHTDFIYAVIGEELGFVGCVAVLAMFVVLLWRGIRIAVRADSLFGMYLGLGIISMILFQALFNISVVLSLVPTKGIPLPFISVGGSSILIMMTAVGILLNISSHSQAEIRLEEVSGPSRKGRTRSGAKRK